MRDLSERDAIREKHAGRPGISGQVERLMGERENAEAYGQSGRVAELDEQLAGFGYQAARARKAASEEKSPEGARRQPPAQRRSPQERQSSAAAKPPQAAG